LKKVSGIVDRISEETYAVIIVEEVNKEFIVEIEQGTIPLREGLWVTLHLNDNGEIAKIEPNETATEKQEEKVSDIMKRLRKRKGSQYKL